MALRLWLPTVCFILVSPVRSRAGELQLHFIYVGQGDCTLIKTPEGKNILIDCGSTRDGDAVEVRHYIQHIIGEERRVDVLVITHPDADHYNYLRGVLDNLSVEKVLFVGTAAEYTSDNFGDWLASHSNANALTSQDISTESDPSDHFGVGEAQFYILAADEQAANDDTNTRSIVLLVSYKDFDVLLTGDANKQTEAAVLNNFSPQFLDVELLKLGHHGSTTSSTSPFLTAVRAETAVVSAGYNSPYAHPRLKVVEQVARFTSASSPHLMRWGVGSGSMADLVNRAGYAKAIFSTSTNGHILTRSDGATYTISTDVSVPQNHTFSASARSFPVESLALMRAPAVFDDATAMAPAFTGTSGEELTQLTPRVGDNVKLVTKDGVIVIGTLKDAPPGWIGILTPESLTVTNIPASETLVVRRTSPHM